MSVQSCSFHTASSLQLFTFATICKTMVRLYIYIHNKSLNKEANTECMHQPHQFYQRDEDVCAGFSDGGVSRLQRTISSLNTLCGS